MSIKAELNEDCNEPLNGTWPVSWLLLGSITGLTLYLFLSPLTWLVHRIAAEPFSSLLLLLLPIAWYFRPKSLFFFQTLRFSPLPSVLFWIMVVVYLANEHYLGVHIFSAALFVGALYSLSGLVLTPSQWRGLFLPFCLLIFLLPFEGYLDVYLGFPLRLLCADLAGQVLQTLGFPSITKESLILIEQKTANVDLACSGIKGIWTGGIFYLLLSLIEEHKVSLRWLVIGLGFVGCLIVFNVLRIVFLVWLSIVGDFPQLSGLLHQGVGLLGFTLSCILAWVALRITRKASVSAKEENGDQARYSVSLSVLFLLGLLLSLGLYQPYHPSDLPSSFSADLPENFHASSISLTPLEQDFFAHNKAAVTKQRFNVEGITGSLLLVNSRYWKAQHKPDNCYIGQGYRIGFEGTWLLAGGNAVRSLKLDALQRGATENAPATKTALYWFQSASTLTPDYSARVLDGVMHPQKSWLMVSILLDSTADQAQVEKLLLRIQASLANQITRGEANG